MMIQDLFEVVSSDEIESSELKARCYPPPIPQLTHPSQTELREVKRVNISVALSRHTRLLP